MPAADPTTAPEGLTLLPAARWRTLQAEHRRRVDELLAAPSARAARAEKHPVEDFLFSYYSFRPARLRRWTPGPGVALLLDDEAPDLRDHVVVTVPCPDRSGTGAARRALTLDVEAFLARRGAAVSHVLDLLTAVAARPAALGCFGLHEWAMVYRLAPDDVRHPWPLRLGSAGTDAVVESHRIRCSHYDAYRFFTPQALSRNELRPTRGSVVENEQPGCLHVTMDLYKWAYKLAPATPSSLLLACFELARDVRELDMRASPYDLSGLGYSPVAIETAAGKATYAEAQRGFAERAEPLRHNLIELCRTLLDGRRHSPGWVGSASSAR